MADQIQLEIVTPNGRALAETVEEVTAPGVNGEFGVMPGHLPLLTAIRTGLVTYRQGGDTKTCAVGPGFAEAGENKLLILTDDYMVKSSVDPVHVRKEFAEVQAKIEKLLANAEDQSAEANDQKATLIQRENWLATQLDLYGDAPEARMRPVEYLEEVPDDSAAPATSDDASPSDA